MQQDLDLIRRHYAAMSNDEITRAASEDAEGMTKEALAILYEELDRRQLNPVLKQAANAQNEALTRDQFEMLCRKMQDLRCPSCGSDHEKLNGTMISQTMSFLILTQSSRKLKLACPRCLNKATGNALLTSLTLGWWGIPWGPIRTIQSVNHYFKARKQHHNDAPNDYLRGFVANKLGQIVLHQHNKQNLQDLIRR